MRRLAVAARRAWPRFVSSSRGSFGAAAERRLARPEILVELSSTSPARALTDLLNEQPRIQQEFLYDARGSEIYEAIVETPEYYLPRAEAALIADPALAGLAVAPVASAVVVELGAGSGTRSYPIIEAIGRTAGATVYVPGDISPWALEQNRDAFERSFAGCPAFSVAPAVGTHEECLAAAASHAGHRTFLHLGSSVGNLDDAEAVELLALVHSHMVAHDRFVIGVDRPPASRKPEDRVVAAYNDAAGHTAAFTLNALSHVNRALGLDFVEADWKHVAEYDAAKQAIVTHVEALRDCVVRDEKAAPFRSFARGERIFMEQSRKFDLAQISALAAKAGLAATAHWASDDYLLVELRSDVYARTQQRSRWLFGDLVGDHRLQECPIALRNPYAFYLGHVAAFHDLHEIQLPGAETFRADFERGMDPDVDDTTSCHWHSTVSQYPPPATLKTYEDTIFEHLRERWLARREHTAAALMCQEHTHMHHETLLYMIAEDRRTNAASHELAAEPGPRAEPAFVRAELGPRAEPAVVRVPAGSVRLGVGDAEQQELGFVWCNEAPAHEVTVAPFRVSALPVTNREYLAFVEAGGAAPHRWEQSQQTGWHVHSVLDGAASLDGPAGEWPAIVTQEEASRFAAWAGACLLAEPEYHRLFEASGAGSARAGFQRAAVRGNNDYKHRGHTPVGARDDAPGPAVPVFDLVGNGWEWTASAFAPFPGFTPLPAYPDYSTDFFDGKHFVCLGASPFTDRQTIRPSFRNFYQSKYPYMITKFRLAWDD